MALEGQNFIPATEHSAALEQAESLEITLDSKEGLLELQQFLLEEDDRVGWLREDIDLAELDWPEDLLNSLRQYRLEHGDMKRLVAEGMTTTDEAAFETMADAIADQYAVYTEADQRFTSLFFEYFDEAGAESEVSATEEDMSPVETAELDEGVVVAATAESEPDDAVLVDQPEYESAQLPPETAVADTESLAAAAESIRSVEILETIENTWQEVKYLHDALHGAFPKEQRSPAVSAMLSTLKQSFEQAGRIRQTAADFDGNYSADPTVELNRYAQSIEKVRAKLIEYIEQKRDEHDADFAVAAAESREDLQPAIEPEESSTLSTPEAVSSDDVAAEQPATEVAAERLIRDQAAARMVELEQLLEETIAVSETERSTVQWSIDAVRTLLAEEAGIDKIEQAVANANSLAESELTNPLTDAILEKTREITTTAQSFAGQQPEVAETVTAMARMVTDLVEQQRKGKEVTDERIQQAYQNLESFMSDNEAAWLEVCGMRLPAAGPDGVFGARSFRDGLEVALRNHPDLTASPEKHAIAERMVRLLFVVPAAGLSEEQVGQLTDLAKELAVSSRTVEARQAAVKAESTEPVVEKTDTVASEKAAVESGWSPEEKTPADYREENWRYWRRVNSRKLGIEVDEVGEGDVQITVAEKAEAQLQAEPETAPAAVVESLTQTPEGSHLLATMEKTDAINNVVPQPVLESVFDRGREAGRSLTRNYLLGPKYQSFLKEHYASPEAFDRILWGKITVIDTKDIDFWERSFDAPRPSAFEYLRGLTQSELAGLQTLPPGELRRTCIAEGLKYESVLTWIDVATGLGKIMQSTPSTPLEAVFAQSVLEAEMSSR